MAPEDRRNRARTPDADAKPSLSLPPSHRDAFKTPLGPIETDPETVLESVTGPLIAVGDVVTYHLLRAGRTPDVALVDGRTKRQRVDAAIERAVTEGAEFEVENPPGEITETLVRTLAEAIDADERVTVFVDGEEDLAALPAILLGPEGASVVYGQPDEGMVHVQIDEAMREHTRTLLEHFKGDKAVRELLDP